MGVLYEKICVDYEQVCKLTIKKENHVSDDV